MNRFIELKDYDATMHRDILDALTREDKALPEICADRAVGEMRGYLSARYDCDRLFAATGTGRNPVVLMMALDIAAYHLFSIHNPQKMSQVRKDRYDRAVEWMKGVQRGYVLIDGAPSLPEPGQSGNSPFQMKSNPKRRNHF